MPGLQFLEVGHGDGCPGRYTNGDGCTCTPTLTVHTSIDRFLTGERVNRAARRKADRVAAKALRKAARGERA